MPIPLVEHDGRWTFDAKAGAQTIIDRRIGRNELSAIRTLLASVDAQHDYFDRAKRRLVAANMPRAWSVRPDAATGFIGRWPRASPKARLEPLIDAAQDAGYPGELIGGKPIPYEGYFFRSLKAQGPNGDGGAKSYMQSGRMVGGFAFVAWPAVFELEWNYDVHRWAGRRSVSKGPGTRNREHRGGNVDLRPGPHVVTCCNDQRLTASATPSGLCAVPTRNMALARAAATACSRGWAPEPADLRRQLLHLSRLIDWRVQDHVRLAASRILWRPASRPLGKSCGDLIMTLFPTSDADLERRLARRLLEVLIRAALLLAMALLATAFWPRSSRSRSGP